MGWLGGHFRRVVNSAPTIIDPATLSLALYNEQGRATATDYNPAATPTTNLWKGVASTGGSGARYVGQGPVFTAPVVGAAIDGTTSISYTSAAKELSTNTTIAALGGTATAFAFGMLVRINSTAQGRLIHERAAGNDLRLDATAGTLTLMMANTSRTLTYTTGQWMALFGRIEGGNVLFSKVAAGAQTDAAPVAAGAFATTNILDECESSVGEALHDRLSLIATPSLVAADLATVVAWWRFKFPTTGI